MSGDRLISPHTRAQNYDTQEPAPAPEPHTREGRFQDVSTARGSKFIPRSTPGRLIVRFKPADTCCFGQGGFKWDDRMPCCSDGPTNHDGSLVALLRQLGGDSSVALWMKAKADLEIALEGRCCEMGNILLCFSGVFLPLMCFLEGRRQKALTSWLESANATVFAPLGTFAKFQTVTYSVRPGRHEVNEESSWLAVALNPTEVAALQQEPIFWRPGGFGCEPYIMPDCCACFGCCCCVPRCV